MQVVAAAPTPEVHAAVKEHVAQMKRSLGDHLHGGVYLNFVEGAEARESAKKGYSAEAYEQLQRLKEKYDPRNRFNHSYRISSKG
jgi:FAD/FMN-containing dehydrogenase